MASIDLKGFDAIFKDDDKEKSMPSNAINNVSSAMQSLETFMMSHNPITPPIHPPGTTSPVEAIPPKDDSGPLLDLKGFFFKSEEQPKLNIDFRTNQIDEESKKIEQWLTSEDTRATTTEAINKYLNRIGKKYIEKVKNYEDPTESKADEFLKGLKGLFFGESYDNPKAFKDLSPTETEHAIGILALKLKILENLANKYPDIYKDIIKDDINNPAKIKQVIKALVEHQKAISGRAETIGLAIPDEGLIAGVIAALAIPETLPALLGAGAAYLGYKFSKRLLNRPEYIQKLRKVLEDNPAAIEDALMAYKILENPDEFIKDPTKTETALKETLEYIKKDPKAFLKALAQGDLRLLSEPLKGAARNHKIGKAKLGRELLFEYPMSPDILIGETPKAKGYYNNKRMIKQITNELPYVVKRTLDKTMENIGEFKKPSEIVDKATDLLQILRAHFHKQESEAYDRFRKYLYEKQKEVASKAVDELKILENASSLKGVVDDALNKVHTLELAKELSPDDIIDFQTDRYIKNTLRSKNATKKTVIIQAINDEKTRQKYLKSKIDDITEQLNKVNSELAKKEERATILDTLINSYENYKNPKALNAESAEVSLKKVLEEKEALTKEKEILINQLKDYKKRYNELNEHIRKVFGEDYDIVKPKLKDLNKTLEDETKILEALKQVKAKKEAELKKFDNIKQSSKELTGANKAKYNKLQKDLNNLQELLKLYYKRDSAKNLEERIKYANEAKQFKEEALPHYDPKDLKTPEAIIKLQDKIKEQINALTKQAGESKITGKPSQAYNELKQDIEALEEEILNRQKTIQAIKNLMNKQKTAAPDSPIVPDEIKLLYEEINKAEGRLTKLNQDIQKLIARKENLERIIKENKSKYTEADYKKWKEERKKLQEELDNLRYLQKYHSTKLEAYNIELEEAKRNILNLFEYLNKLVQDSKKYDLKDVLTLIQLINNKIGRPSGNVVRNPVLINEFTQIKNKLENILYSFLDDEGKQLFEEAKALSRERFNIFGFGDRGTQHGKSTGIPVALLNENLDKALKINSLDEFIAPTINVLQGVERIERLEEALKYGVKKGYYSEAEVNSLIGSLKRYYLAKTAGLSLEALDPNKLNRIDLKTFDNMLDAIVNNKRENAKEAYERLLGKENYELLRGLNFISKRLLNFYKIEKEAAPETAFKVALQIVKITYNLLRSIAQFPFRFYYGYKLRKFNVETIDKLKDLIIELNKIESSNLTEIEKTIKKREKLRELEEIAINYYNTIPKLITELGIGAAIGYGVYETTKPDKEEKSLDDIIKKYQEPEKSQTTKFIDYLMN